jgi:membrane protease YdiL (CAAX protease family)
VFVSGAVTFLVSLPFLLLAANVWELVLKQFNLPTERQSLIAMFANAESPLLLMIMILLAIVIAPLTEELVFRAGLFRFLRGRAPRWVALAAPGLIFASLHVNWSTLEGLTSLAPLVVLAVMFSLAYEHTGNIGTPIVAHALFNLNTVILIFSGLPL